MCRPESARLNTKFRFCEIRFTAVEPYGEKHVLVIAPGFEGGAFRNFMGFGFCLVFRADADFTLRFGSGVIGEKRFPILNNFLDFWKIGCYKVSEEIGAPFEFFREVFVSLRL